MFFLQKIDSSKLKQKTFQYNDLYGISIRFMKNGITKNFIVLYF